MRLYLSSYKLGNYPEEFVRLVGRDNKRVAIISNASDYKTPDEKFLSVQREIESLNTLGFLAEEIDLRKYFNKK